MKVKSLEDAEKKHDPATVVPTMYRLASVMCPQGWKVIASTSARV